jgi:hypothetical protein
VHGTWAAPEPAANRWYQQIDGGDAAAGFVAKLDTALQKRGSAARCWAHCTADSPIFQWSGENSWIARTRAASALGDYVAKLRKDGWRYHILAHSHGGNVVVEALPQIVAAPTSNDLPSTIVTLGTPFIDTMSPIFKRVRRAHKVLNVLSWIGFAIVTLILAYSYSAFARSLSIWWHSVFVFAFVLLAFPVCFSVYEWFSRRGKAGNLAEAEPRFLAMSSQMDEAWQILHHTRNFQNPLAVKSNLFSYLFRSTRSNMARSAQVARICGAKSYGDLGVVARIVMALTHLVTTVFIVLMIIGTIALLLTSIPTEAEAVKTKFSDQVLGVTVTLAFLSTVLLIFVMFLTKLLGETFYSAFLSPFRWCRRRALFLGNIFAEGATYIVRNRGWSVLQTMIMGLEGYPFRIPGVEQHPSNAPQDFVKYENMPEGAEQRALAMRNAWIGRHFGDVTQTFSKVVVTAADMTLLLRTVEADQSLVHAAYYTDDECIQRVADWIAGAGSGAGQSEPDRALARQEYEVLNAS